MRWKINRITLAGLCIVGLIVLFASGAAVRAHISTRTMPAANQTSATPAAKDTIQVPANEPVALTSRILLMGDTYWGRAINVLSQNSPLKEAFPFSRLNEFGRSNYDAWVANLECPSVPGVNQPYSVEVKSLQFNCPSTFLPEAAKWFTVFSLANNHTANQGGRTGLDATRGALEAQGIQYFGDFDPQKLADACEVITVQTNVSMSGGSQVKGAIPIALCGYHGLSAAPSAESLAVMQRFAKYMPVLAYPHMGVEYTAQPTSAQQNLYRAMIDNGADAVLGGHPHWVQPAEAYKHKLIVYSLGDFIFDQGPGETQRGAMIDLTLSLSKGTSVNAMNSWLKLGAACKTYHDDCLAQVESQGLKKLPWTFRYDVVGADLTDHLTRPAKPDLLQTIKTRLKWDLVKTEL